MTVPAEGPTPQPPHSHNFTSGSSYDPETEIIEGPHKFIMAAKMETEFCLYRNSDTHLLAAIFRSPHQIQPTLHTLDPAVYLHKKPRETRGLATTCRILWWAICSIQGIYIPSRITPFLTKPFQIPHLRTFVLFDSSLHTGMESMLTHIKWYIFEMGQVNHIDSR